MKKTTILTQELLPPESTPSIAASLEEAVQRSSDARKTMERAAKRFCNNAEEVEALTGSLRTIEAALDGCAQASCELSTVLDNADANHEEEMRKIKALKEKLSALEQDSERAVELLVKAKKGTLLN